MSLFPPDFRYMVKHCFAACPPGMYCECAERMRWEDSPGGRAWLQEQAEAVEKATRKMKEQKEFRELFEGL